MSGLTVVTGASGFIGRYVARQLLERGQAVRLLVRRPELLPPEIAARAQVIRGDIREAGSIDRALDGADRVIHLAACARAWSRDPSEFQAVNVDAVDRLVMAARRHRVHRIVHTSTILTLMRPPGGRRPTPYEATKLAGERIVEESGRGMVAHPTRVYGPGPLNDANGVTRLIEAYLRHRVVVRLDDDDVQANYVHVEDVARGLLLAADRGEPGAHYVLGGENVSVRELLERVAALSGVRRAVVPVPPKAALAVGLAAEAWGWIYGTAPITRRWVRCFLEDQRLNGEPTPPGYEARSLDDGLTMTIRWLRQRERRS